MVANKNLKTPLRMIIVYLVFTQVLYAWGPFKWVTYYPAIFWMLNFLFLFAFIVGWNCGLKTNVTKYQIEDNHTIQITRNLRYLITINFVYVLINSFRRFRINSFNMDTLINSIISGLADMGGSYNALQDSVGYTSADALGGIVVTLFNLVWGFLAFNVLILGVIFFKKISIYNKIILALTVALIVAEYMATGTNIGVFRVILIFVLLFFLRVVRENQKIKKKINKKNKKQLIILSIVAVVVVLVLFDHIMKSRGGILFWQSASYNISGIYLNWDSVFFEYMPDSLYMIFVALSGYLCQGYYGMSLSLTIPWEPGYGVGHSMAIINILDKIVKFPHENIYQYRLTELGWEEGLRWHTMYSWFANDITYIGVIFVMFSIGVIFAMAYRDAVLTNSPYAKLVTYYMVLLAFFIPCNNQLFQSTSIMFAFFTALFLWLSTRGKKRLVFTIRGRKLW